MKKKMPDDVLEFFRKSGAKGGKARAANMTPAQRRRSALKASRAAARARKEKAKSR